MSEGEKLDLLGLEEKRSSLSLPFVKVVREVMPPPRSAGQRAVSIEPAPLCL